VKRPFSNPLLARFQSKDALIEIKRSVDIPNAKDNVVEAIDVHVRILIEEPPSTNAYTLLRVPPWGQTAVLSAPRSLAD
jgi:hypothetical protein